VPRRWFRRELALDIKAFKVDGSVGPYGAGAVQRGTLSWVPLMRM
jgi:hypothetical protein